MRWPWLVGCIALAGVAAASDDAPGGPRRGPPPEALQACTGLQEGASCSFTTPNGHQLSGTCRTGPQGEPAACAPSGPHHGGFGPPPEALQACNGLSAGASCSFTLPDGNQLTGTCRSGPDGSNVACAPAQPPPQR